MLPIAGDEWERIKRANLNGDEEITLEDARTACH
jgi:hypothetical protein